MAAVRKTADQAADGIRPCEGGRAEAAEEELARQLAERARAEGLSLTGPGGLLGRLTKVVLEGALEGEMDAHLGYGKHDPAGRDGGNSRNGHRAKTVLTDVGPVQVDVPRDRDASFAPKIAGKRQRRLGGVDDMVISLVAKGLTTGEVQAHLAEIYGAQVSRDTISAITDRVLDGLAEWQSRPLDPVYAVLFIDVINVKIRDGNVASRPIYVVLGVTAEGERDIVGLWAGEHGDGEGAKYWLRVLSEVKNRGTCDVLMVICDGLTGLPDAIAQVWPAAITQTCIVHLLRNSFRYASRKDWAAIATALRPVYTAPSEAAALDAFAEFSGTWETRYPAIVRLWENAWAEFVPFLRFDQAIRTLISTTNAIESLNARFRRSVKARGHFLSVTWNQGPGSRSLRYGLAGNWKEGPCLWRSGRSGRCWPGTSWRAGGCRSGPTWDARPGRSTRMPAGWPSTWTSASGRTSTRPRPTAPTSRCSSAS